MTAGPHWLASLCREGEGERLSPPTGSWHGPCLPAIHENCLCIPVPCCVQQREPPRDRRRGVRVEQRRGGVRAASGRDHPHRCVQRRGSVVSARGEVPGDGRVPRRVVGVHGDVPGRRAALLRHAQAQSARIVPRQDGGRPCPRSPPHGARHPPCTRPRARGLRPSRARDTRGAAVVASCSTRCRATWGLRCKDARR